MSKVKNIITGKRYMTDQNAVRHFLKLARKAKTTDKKRKVYNDALSEMVNEIVCCDACSAEDFGICGLRYSDMLEIEKFEKYCFPAFVAQLEKAEIKQYKNMKKADKNKVEQNSVDKNTLEEEKYSGNINEYYKLNGKHILDESKQDRNVFVSVDMCCRKHGSKEIAYEEDMILTIDDYKKYILNDAEACDDVTEHNEEFRMRNPENIDEEWVVTVDWSLMTEHNLVNYFSLYEVNCGLLVSSYVHNKITAKMCRKTFTDLINEHVDEKLDKIFGTVEVKCKVPFSKIKQLNDFVSRLNEKGENE